MFTTFPHFVLAGCCHHARKDSNLSGVMSAHPVKVIPRSSIYTFAVGFPSETLILFDITARRISPGAFSINHDIIDAIPSGVLHLPEWISIYQPASNNALMPSNAPSTGTLCPSQIRKTIVRANHLAQITPSKSSAIVLCQSLSLILPIFSIFRSILFL